MGQDTSTGGPSVSSASDGPAVGTGTEPDTEPMTPETERIEREIQQTRDELGDTVEALAAKTDVKAQAREKVEETKAALADKKDELLGKAREASPESASGAASAAADQARENPVPLAAAGAFVAGFLFGRVTKRRR